MSMSKKLVSKKTRVRKDLLVDIDCLDELSKSKSRIVDVKPDDNVITFKVLSRSDVVLAANDFLAHQLDSGIIVDPRDAYIPISAALLVLRMRANLTVDKYFSIAPDVYGYLREQVEAQAQEFYGRLIWQDPARVLSLIIKQADRITELDNALSDMKDSVRDMDRQIGSVRDDVRDVEREIRR